MLDIDKLIEEMTLEEKAGLCSGSDMWHTKPVKRLGLPAIKMSDGPHGMRTFNEEGKVIPAICFPTGSALAASFDVGLLESIGAALGETARATGVHTVLGPSVNMKRSPLCGRNFEYLSEDPYVAGELGSALARGIQSKGVGACPKHFAANNQETNRMSVNAIVDERSLREIYLSAFEMIVKKASPHTMMCSYNRINGTYACENKHILDDILRKEWGYDGIVMTDWSAMNKRPKALAAGLELEMPTSYGENDRLIAEAVRSGALSMDILDEAVRRLLTWIDRELEGTADAEADYDKEVQRALARDAAARCAVLLKNDGTLPLRWGDKIAFIGGFADKPRFEGGGSSHVNVTDAVSALAFSRDIPNISYAEGFNTEDDLADCVLLAEAVRVASEADTAVIFAGLPNSFESEGHDRSTLAIPESQNRLIEAVCAVQPRTVVVFHAGSPVYMPWRGDVSAILYMYLGGQEVGSAAIDLLFGDKNPSGKLAETFPLRLEDTSCYIDFPGTGYDVNYAEGIYIGYRWYDKRKIPVEYPFGFGLSYTTFAYMNMRLSSDRIIDTDTLTVYIDVQNTGTRAGNEIVQLYVQPCEGKILQRPVKELKGFKKLSLKPGEVGVAVFELDKRSFAGYNPGLSDWYVESGNYVIRAGSSSVDLLLSESVFIESTTKLPILYSDYMTVGDLWDCDLDVDEALELMKTKQADLSAVGLSPDQIARDSHMEEVKRGMPIHATVSMSERDMKKVYEALYRINGLEGKENIPL